MKEVMSPMLRFWKLLRPYRKEIYQIYIFAILIGLVNLSLPLGIQAIFNLIQGGQITSSWVILVGVVLVGIAITGILQVFQLRVVEDIQQHIFVRSSIEFAYRLPKIKLSELNNIHTPELANRFFDTLTIQKSLPKILIDFSLAAFQVIFGIILLSIYSTYFIILGLLLVFLIWVIFKLTGAKGLETSLKESKYKYKLAHWLEEVARTNQSFKLSPNSDMHLSVADGIATNYLHARENHFGVLVQQFKYFISFKVIIAAGLLILGSILVFEEQMNLGQFVASEIIIILIINSIEKIIRVTDVIYDVLTALEKIGYVTDLPLDKNPKTMQPKFETGISVETVNLEFGYPGMKDKILNKISINVPKSSKTVITGKSGSGKSTLLHLIAGLYEFENGSIRLDGVPISNFNRQELYSQVGFYFPSNQLFEGTILNNITFGKEFSNRELFDIIDILGLKEFISSQPEGIETPVSSEGKRLPRSIIQKILLARSIIHRPKLLLLESPLQSLVVEERMKIIDYIMDKERDWTVILVADIPYWKEKSTQIIELP